MPDTYDVIVVGLGAVGTATLYQLAERGARVLGLERQPASPHSQGSSHGQSRLLRVAYQEGAHYVPLVRRAIDLWRETERHTETSLFQQTGLYYAGPESSPLLSGSRAAAEFHGVEIIECGADKLSNAFSDIPPDWQVLYEPEGGYIYIEQAIEGFLSVAKSAGAGTRFNAPVHSFTRIGDRIEVTWACGSAQAKSVIVTAGPWASDCLAFLRPCLNLERRVLHWYTDQSGQHGENTGFAPFAFQPDENDMFYGFPAIDARGIKIANHSVLPLDPISSPEAVDRKTHPSDAKEVDAFVARHMPGLGPRQESAVCIYTMSRDGHFIIDRHPELENLYFTAGLSGHGFKFAPVLGEIMAGLALTGRTDHELMPFRLERFVN